MPRSDEDDCQTSRTALSRLDRRSFLRRGLAGVGGLAAFPLAGCGADGIGDEWTTAPARSVSGGGPVRDVRLVAESGEVEVGSGRTYRTWMYNGQFPGPEIRAKEGELLRITVENRLPDPTTVHWHGIPLPNAMDGVPGLTQEPFPPGRSMVYEFEAAPADTYIYHSHVGLQLDRGLLGPLIIEETEPHVAFDREHVLVLDDFLPGEPRSLEELTGDGDGMGMMGGMMGGDRDDGRSMMERMGTVVPPYEGLLVNGRLPDAPSEFDVRRGERVRLRLINPGGATTYRVAVAGHQMTVTHTDGRPVAPVEVDSLYVGMGERYDVLIQADNPGVWPIAAATMEGDGAPARTVLRYAGAAGKRLRDGLPEGLASGRVLEYADLQSVEDLPSSGDPDRTFNLTLSGGMMMNPNEWTIDGQAYPDAEPLEIAEGERVRVNIMNMSMMIHPMHLHAHFFRTGGIRKDTMIVRPHMGRASFDFVADNPGRWFFHCHNLYHLHAGRAREFRYV